MSNELQEMEILEHLDELRKRIIVCIVFTMLFSILAYIKSDTITALLKSPLGRDINLVFINPIEGFLTKIKVAAFGGIVLASPVLFFQTLRFISPGLHRGEKILLFSSFPFIVSLFFSGIYFCFRFILPTTLKYLMSFGNEHMQPMLSVGKYFSFVIMLTITIGAVFELPMVMLLLSKFGIINYKVLAKKRKYVLFIIVVITAILTPTPDAFTLLAVSIPLVLLFELSLGVMYIYHRFIRRRGDEEAV